MDGRTVSDDDLAALALAAGPDALLDDDAVPFRGASADDSDGLAPLLPGWHLPAPASGSGHPPWLRWVVALVVASFVAIDAYGLGSTYGPVAFH